MSGSTFIGVGALANGNAEDIDDTTVIGYKSANVMYGGGSNTFIGSKSGLVFESGSNNTFIGAKSGILAQSSGNNTCVGSSAGAGIIFGSGNIFIGTGAGASLGDVSNTLDIGGLIGGNLLTGILQMPGGILDIVQVGIPAAPAAGTSRLYASSAAGSRLYNIPDAGANAALVMTEGNQTINGVKTFTSSVSNSGGLQLATTGGVPATLNFYEEITFNDVVTTGFVLGAITITGTRVGNQVTLHFPPRTGVSGAGGILDFTSVGSFPARWRPNGDIDTSTFIVMAYDGSLMTGILAWDPTPGVEQWFLRPLNGFSGFTAGPDRGNDSSASISYNII